jgi:hypothetical protein
MQWLYLGKFAPHTSSAAAPTRLSLRNAVLIPRGVHAVVYPIPKVRRGDFVLCVEHPYMASGTVVGVTEDISHQTEDIVVRFEHIVLLNSSSEAPEDPEEQPPRDPDLFP